MEQERTIIGNEESKQWLYKNMTKAGYNVGKDYNQFNEVLQDDTSRQWLYDEARKMKWNVGDEKTFHKLMGYEIPKLRSDISSSAPSPTSLADNALNAVAEAKEPAKPVRIPTDFGNVNLPTPIEAERAGLDNLHNQINKSWRTQIFEKPTTDMEAAMTMAGEQKTPEDLLKTFAQAWSEHSDEGKAMLKNMENVYNDTQNAYLQQFQQTQEYANLVSKLQKEVKAKKLTPEQAGEELSKLFIAQYGNKLETDRQNLYSEYLKEAQAALEQSPYQKDWNRVNAHIATDQNKDLNSRINAELEKRTNEIKQQKQSAPQSPLKLARDIMADRKGDVEVAKATKDLQAAKAFATQAEDMITSVRESKNFFADFGKSFGKTITSNDTWDFGVGQLMNSIALKNAADKADKGEPLTHDEELLLEAAANYMAVSMYYSDKVGRGTKAGQTTAASIPFMLEFMLTSGVGAAMTNATTRGITRFAIRMLGNGARKKGVRIGAEVAGKTLSDIGYAELLTNTLSAPRIAEGTISRMNGSVKPQLNDSKDGFRYDGRTGQQELEEALWNAHSDQFIENYSEVVFGALDPLKDPAKAAIKSSKLLGKMAAGVESNAVTGTLIRAWNNPTAVALRKETRFGGLFEETMEEEIGGLFRLVANTDVNNAKDAGLDIDSQIDIVLGLAPSVLLMNGAGATFHYSKQARDVRKMREYLKTDEERQMFDRVMSESRSGEFGREAHDFIREIVMNNDIPNEAKRQIILQTADKYKDVLSNDLVQQAQQIERQDRTARRETVIRERLGHQTNESDGKVYRVSIAGSDTENNFIKKGTIVLNEDGTIDQSQSAGYFVVAVTDNDGNTQIKQVPVSAITNIEGGEAAEDMAQEEIEYYNTLDQAHEMFPEGSIVTIPNSNGAVSEVHYDERGNILVDVEGGQQVKFTPKEAMDKLVPVHEETPQQPEVDRNPTPQPEPVPQEENPEPTQREIVTFNIAGADVPFEKVGDQYYMLDADNQRTGRPFSLQDLQEKGAQPIVAETPQQGEQVDITNPKPIGTNKFGNVYQWVTGKAKEAAQFLRQHKNSYLKGVFHRDDIGDIDLVWGNDKAGLQHIVKRHILEQTDFDSISEAIEAIGETIKNGNIEYFDSGNVAIDNGKFRVILAQDKNGNWIVTAYDNSKPREEKQKNASSTTPQVLPSKEQGTLPDVGVSHQSGTRSDGKGTENNSNTQVPAPNIDTMSPEELGASAVEYLGDKASAVAYLEAERDKADAEVKRLAKQKVTRYTDIADFKRQNDELQAAKKAAADRYNKLQNAIATANNYKTKVEQAAEAERKAREEERRATRRQTQTAQLANAAPAERWKAAPKVEGNAVTRTLSDGTVIKGHYILVEAGAATSSHDPFNGWNTSNGFPVTDDGKNINDRDYKNDTDAQQITTQIAQTYDGQAVAQVPVVSSEGIVYDGNGRTIAGNIAAANNTDGAYIQALADNAGNFGFAPEQVAGMQHPRVYMQTDEDLPYNTTTFAKFNAQEKKSQGSTNRAVSSSKKLTEAARDGMLRILDNYGTLDAFFASEAGAKDIVHSLLDNGIITQQEVAGLTENTDRGFVLSPAGKDYVTDLLIGGLFDEKTIRMLGNDKGLKQSILRAMPSIVENRRLGDYALTDNINNAIRLLYEARQAGMAYPLYVKQGNAFDGYVSDRFSPFELLLAEEMSSGVETFRQVLNLYNNSARDEANGQAGLFEPRTIEDIKNEILQHYGKSINQSAATAAESTQSRPANTQTEPPAPSAPAGDGQEQIATDIPASNILEQIEAEAEPFEEIELTPANWYALFGEDGIVSTPIGYVKMGEHQYLKLAQKGRDGKLGMIKPTLEHPSVVVMDKSQAKDGQNTEREFSYVFVKAFVGKNGERLYYFTSITVSKDGQEVVISNQEKERSRIQRLLKNGKLAYINKATLPPASDKTIQGDQLTNPVGEELSSADKGTKNIPNSQTPEQKSAENLPNASQDEQSHTEEAPKYEQSKDNGGKEQSQSQQSNTPKTFAQERTDVDLRTLRGAIQIQEIEDLPKDIAPNSLIEVAADDDFGTIVRIGFKNKDLYVQTESKDADGKQWRHTFIVPNARQHVIANIADKFYGNQVSDFTDEEREALKDALYKADTIEHLNGMRQGNIAYQKASAHITDETTDTEIHAITELTEAPERQFAQWVDTLNAGNIRRVAKALNENTSLEAMRALGIAKRAFSRKAREELGDIAKSYVGSTYKLSDVKRVAIAYAADNIYHSDNVPNKETIEAYVEKIYNEAKAARIAELEADLGKPLSLDDKKALIKQISDGKTKVVLVTNKTIVKKLAELGATRKTIADVAAAVSRGDKVKGFFAKGMVILNTDVLQTGNDIIATYVHERQHLLAAANPQILSVITDNASADELAQILRTITGTTFYDQYNNGTTNGHTALADELVSHIMQEAYATGRDAAEVAKGYGINNETILKTLNNIDYEQRQSNNLSKARRDNILGRNTQNSSRQSGRNNQTQSKGGLVQQRSRPAGKGSSGTPSRGHTPERGEIADTPVSALSFDEQAKSLKELISFQSKEEEQYFDSILPNLKADKLGVNNIPLEVILNEFIICEEIGDVVLDYVAEHYPTQANISALTDSPQGKQEREAMRKDPVLAQLRKEVSEQQDAAKRKINNKYEEARAITDNPSITLGEVAQLWNNALEFCRSLDTENGIRFSVGNAGNNLHKSLKSSTFADRKSSVPKAELAAAYADMFRKQTQGQFADGNGYAYSANYFHFFENGRIALSIPIEGNEDYIKDYQSKHGTNSSTGTFSQGAGHLWRSQRPSVGDNGIPQRQRSRNERVDRLHGAVRTDGAPDNQKVHRDTQSGNQTGVTDPRFSVSGTQVVPLGERTLVGLHNITSDKLRKVLKAGGLANPSAAVIDIAKQDHHGYGEISLVMPASLVDSDSGNNAGAYTGDMWSPTYPTTERRMSDKGADAYYKALNSAFGNDPARRGLWNKISLGFSNWLIGQHDPKDFAYWYMLEKGITPEDVLYNSGVPASVKQRFAPIAGKRLYEYSEEDRELLLSLIAEQRGITVEELKQEAQELRQRYQETLDDPDSKVFQRRIAQDAIEDIDTYGVKYNVLEKGIDDLQNAIKNDGKIDIDATLSKAEKQVQTDYKDDFDKWLNDFDKRFGIKEYIFDGYTRDGDRKYIPDTLANASRLMNREELQNAGSHGGFNATKGQLIERMNTLADIRANKYRLTSKEGEKDEQWEQLGNEWFNNIIDPLAKMRRISDNPFSNVDYAEQRLLEALRQKDPIAHLNKEYGYSIAKDSAFAKALNDLVQRIKDLPAKYFETKFKRPVYLNEFRNAVVPNTLPQDLRDGLQQAGLGLYEYDPKAEGSRRKATLQATEADGIRFSIIGDYDIDNLTNVQQLATDAVLGALDDAGIPVERVSEEEAEREVEKEKSESSVRLIRQMAEGTKGQSNNPITSAKVQKNLEVAKEKYKKYGISTENAITDISKALGARNTGTSNYITIEAKNGTIFTLRLSNHNATVANFDNNGETNGISIVISRHNNKGITNNGDAHIVEFFYSDKSLNKADGTPIADIIGALEQTMYSGEYTDPTGLAQRQEVNIPAELQSAEFSIRQTPAPKNTGIGYKVFYRGKDGKLYPPMVANPNGADTPIGVWLNADAAPISGESKTGRPQVKAGGKGTQGGSGQLAYRPGWHLGEIPYALQFNRKDENGDRTLFPKDFVWAEVEYAADVNYQQEAKKEGVTENGKYRHSYAGLKHLPTDGYYRYRTNPNPETDPWIITGAMKVNRVLTNEEVDALVLQAGREPQQREFLRTSNGTIYGYAKDGKIYLTDRGLNPNTPIHEYTHLWAKAMQAKNLQGWQSVVDLLKGTPMWDEVANDPHYSHLTDDNAVASEVLSRYSGSHGAQLFEQKSKSVLEQNPSIGAFARVRVLLNNVREALNKFWNWVGKDLFHIDHFDSIEEVADRILYDLTNGTDLSTGIKDGVAEMQIAPLPKKEGESIADYAKRMVDYQNSFAIDQSAQKAQFEYEKHINEQHSALRKLEKGVTDFAKPIMSFQEYMVKQGAVMDIDSDTYQDIWRAGSRTQTAINKYHRECEEPLANTVKSIVNSQKLNNLGFVWQNLPYDALKKNKDQMNNTTITPRRIVGLYLQAKDCEEALQLGLVDRGAAGFEQNVCLPNVEGYEHGVPYTKIIEMVEDALGKDIVDILWKRVRAAVDYGLDYQVKRGMISEETRNKYKREFYVPQRGWEERDMSGLATDYQRAGGALYGSPYNLALKQAKGRTSLAADPFAYITSIAYSSITSADDNVTRQHLLKFCLDNEELGLQSGAFRIKKFWVVREIDADGNIIGEPTISYAQPTERMYEHDKEINAKLGTIRKQLGELNRLESQWQSVVEIENINDVVREAVNKKLQGIREEKANLEKEAEALSSQLCVLNSRSTDGFNLQLSEDEIGDLTKLDQDTHRTKAELNQHIIYVEHNGQKYALLFKNEQIPNALNKTYKSSLMEIPLISEAARKATRLISATLTQYNPEFAARNYIKDRQTAITTLSVEQGAKFTAKFEANLNSPLLNAAVMQYAFNDNVRDRGKVSGKYKDLLNEYFEHGAQTGYSFLPDLQRVRKDFDKLLKNNNAKEFGKATINMLSVLTEASETSIRFAAYVTARESGMSADAAASLSKELTTNFDRHGEWSNSALMSLYSFMRATINGNLKYLRGFKKFPIGFSIAAAAYYAAGVLCSLLNPNDPDNDIWFTDYVRETNITLGKFLGITAKIPLGHFMVMFYAAGVNTVAGVRGNKSAGEAVFDTMQMASNELLPSWMNFMAGATYDTNTGMGFDATQFAQSAAPSVVSPFVDVWLNRNFMGGRISNEYDWNKDEKDILKYKSGTSQFYIDMANGLYEAVGGDLKVKNKLDDNTIQKLVDVSPSTTEHIVEGYSPAIAETILQTAAVIQSAAKGADIAADELPFVRKFYSSYHPERAAAQQYYMLKSRSKDYSDLLKEYQKKDRNKYNSEKAKGKVDLNERTQRALKRIKLDSPSNADIKTLMELNREWNKID